MKVLLDIKDNKASFVMELLNSLAFVKVRAFSNEKLERMASIGQAVEELNLIKQGKLNGIPARDLLNEL